MVLSNTEKKNIQVFLFEIPGYMVVKHALNFLYTSVTKGIDSSSLTCCLHETIFPHDIIIPPVTFLFILLVLPESVAQINRDLVMMSMNV